MNADILTNCVSENHPNDGVNEMIVGRRTIHVCNDCYRAYMRALSEERKARKSKPRAVRRMATGGAAGEWNMFVALTLAVNNGTLPTR